MIEFVLNVEKKDENKTLNYQVALLEKKNTQLEDKVKMLKDNNNTLVDENNKIREEYNKIIYSRSYKIIQIIKRIIKRG